MSKKIKKWKIQGDHRPTSIINTEKANIPKFTYYPSNEIKYLEIHLDQKIMFFERMLEQQIETLKQF